MTIFATTWMIAAEAATHEAATSSGGISAIGIDLKSLVFQVVNFAILFFVLKKVAYGPIVKVLDARKQRIEESLKTAAQLEKQQAEWQTEQAKLLAEAREQAAEIVAASRTEATEVMQSAAQKAQQQTKQLIEEAHGRIEQQLEEAKRGLRKDLAHLVVQATEVILQKKLDDKTDLELIERTLAGKQ